jgi:hypothetical protein
MQVVKNNVEKQNNRFPFVFLCSAPSLMILSKSSTSIWSSMINSVSTAILVSLNFDKVNKFDKKVLLAQLQNCLLYWYKVSYL